MPCKSRNFNLNKKKKNISTTYCYSQPNKNHHNRVTASFLIRFKSTISDIIFNWVFLTATTDLF